MNEGYDTTSMDRIAESAGASKRTVYNHFPSKEALFKAVLERMMSETMALKRIDYSPDRPLEDQLAQFADAKLAFVKNPAWLGMLKVAIAVFIGNPDLAREIMMQAEDEKDYLAEWLTRAHRDGRLNVSDPCLAAKAFWAMVGGAFILPVIFGEDAKLPGTTALKSELVRIFLSRYLPE